MANKNDKYPLAAIRQARLDGDADLLLRSLRSDDHRVRGAAARSLGMLKEPRAVKPLLNMLDDPEYGNRVIATKALARLGGTFATDPLYGAALGQSPIGVRTAAMTALVRLGDRRALRPIAELLVSPTLGQDIAASPMRPRGSAASLRRWAAKTLREQHASEALPVLKEALNQTRGLRRLQLQRVIRALARS